MTKDLVVNFLREEGYVPKIDDDGDVLFRAEGRAFLYFANNDDPNFFQLTMPGIFAVTEDNREMVLEACNGVTRQIKVAKAVIIDQQNDVWLFFENILDHTPNVEDIMPRAIRTLLGAQKVFNEKIR